MDSSSHLGTPGCAAELRRELSLRSRKYAQRLNLDCRESYGDSPVICFVPGSEGASHGNFLPAAYRAITSRKAWAKRLEKVHTSARTTLPREDRRWRELDSCNSSDALLMNIFCYPGTLRNRHVLDLLGVNDGCTPEFGFRARVPLADGRSDRTEIDLRLGNLLVEAKLTESDFQSAEAALVESYAGLGEVFESNALPRMRGRYVSYQLIRNVLAAHHNDCSFCVMLDARRPDLREAWFAVMSCVQILDLRLRCKVLTWQELSQVLPAALRRFLNEKYGIVGEHDAAIPLIDSAESQWTNPWT